MQTTLGIDYGEKRVGLALAQSGHASALETVASVTAIARIVELVAEHNIQTAVVGLPRNLDGDDTAQTAAARSFATQVEEATGISVTLQDEALTSELARERLESRGKKPDRHDGTIDAEAAAIILQDYIDSL